MEKLFLTAEHDRLNRIFRGHWNLRTRVILLLALGWAIPLVMAVFQAHSMGQRFRFLNPFSLHAVFLIALPTLIFSQHYLSRVTGRMIQRFREEKLLGPDDERKFDQLVAAARQQINSLPIAVLTVAAILVTAYYRPDVGYHRLFLRYRQIPADANISFDYVGFWVVWVTLPTYQFVVLRWVWRYAVWTWLLCRISRLDLRLLATHADRAAGLSFVEATQVKFSIIVFSISVIFSSAIGQELVFGGRSLGSFKNTMLMFVLLGLLVIYGPLLVFSPVLAAAKREGKRRYACLVMDHARAFDDKWIRGPRPPDESILGHPDVSSLTDISTSYQVIVEMKIFMSSRINLMRTAAAALLPTLPLAATIVPLGELVKQIMALIK